MTNEYDPPTEEEMQQFRDAKLRAEACARGEYHLLINATFNAESGGFYGTRMCDGMGVLTRMVEYTTVPEAANCLACVSRHLSFFAKNWFPWSPK